MELEFRKATLDDYLRIMFKLRRWDISFVSDYLITSDFNAGRLYVVGSKHVPFATISLVPEPDWGYTAMKRLVVFKPGQGIGRFAIQSAQLEVKGKIGATPWDDNNCMCHLLESEGFRMEYKFMEKWCFYSKERE